MNRETLFWTAIKLPEPARERFIEEACPDREVREWLQRMVENYREGDSFLEDPPAFDEAATTVAGPAHSPEIVSSPFPQIPGCEIERVLGEGGMGVVYKARQAGLERPAAVKLLKVRGALGDDELAERFRREAKSMARLNHPNIVSIYDSGQTVLG
ncbi:MAG: protein kinase domain-containing protein, partial [Verrucomicrobiales bacterium]